MKRLIADSLKDSFDAEWPRCLDDRLKRLSESLKVSYEVECLG